MARGRRVAKREGAQERQLDVRDRAERERQDALAASAQDNRLARKWGNERSGLDRLSALSKELEKLHREQARLLQERDDLVGWLRRGGQSWTALSARTKLSRQALMKRTIATQRAHE